ncbi:hypothetical protein [Winogradskyella tangerina]|uniref:hypothetical protein n=1 Tax=Winogradskyella tangerina TaxID=2023240 RepID=UPI000DBE1A77|nr:hypothetical protein [Winogradskyella tangerina]
MAPIKFEEQLKEKLEERNLQPSSDAWSKLSERLDEDEKRSRKPWITWLSVAAGVIIMLSVLIQSFGSKTDQEVTPQMVEEDVIELPKQDQLPIINENETIELAVEEDTSNEVNTSPEESKEDRKLIDPTSGKKEQPKLQLAEQSTNDVQPKNSIEKPNEIQKAIVNETQINKEAVAQALNELNSEKTRATDREVDSLLKLASKELVKDKLLKETSKTVDAQSLLNDVEDEMGQSFRSKVYEALKGGYKTVKTAVAQRNN